MLQFVTTNTGKVNEAREYLPVSVEQLEYDYTEIQSMDLEEISRAGVREAAQTVDDEVFVEDSGLFINSLDGFPGPYSSYVYATLGIDRVADLVQNEADRTATFRSVIAYSNGDRVRTFKGEVVGRIVEPRGTGGFGYDPIFEHEGQTFAEMTTEEKNSVSHRGRALVIFAEWLDEECTGSRNAQ